MAIKNLDRLARKLNSLATQPLTEEALAKAATVVQADARRNAPRGDTGLLAMSIQTDVNVAEQKAVIGTNIEYAPYVELGTGIFAAEGNGRKTPWSYQDAKGNWHTTVGQQPQPFLYPALDSNRENIKKIFEKEVNKEVKKHGGR